ncbi:E3 ubiquitin-protein ligase RNF180-like [Oppia nitens]|uniref:E3 ubiquitin-protein ligase RNF180-like n=1 Tax=Oppia nitens TaxID=1686743 RepID=UPI0023DC89D9|nr:E3 ubiquitin-protein ligase RNF180-like [Oppia nitens]
MTDDDVKCAKCRHILFADSLLVTSHGVVVADDMNNSGGGGGHHNNQCSDYRSNTVCYVTEHSMNDWMRQQIDSGDWTKGRLQCPNHKCSARIGSYDFITGQKCRCGRHALPNIQFSRSRIDRPLPLNNINNSSGQLAAAATTAAAVVVTSAPPQPPTGL